MTDPRDTSDESSTDGGERRITADGVPDDPMVPVDLNVSIAEDPSQVYEGVRVSRMSMRITRSRVIDPRYSLDEVVALIGEFFDEFPTDVPLVEQSARWVRFFAGFHLFQDANHRTGMNTLEVAMLESGPENTPPVIDGREHEEETKVARKKSKRVRDVREISSSRIFEDDRLYHVWYDYFDDVLSP